MELRRHLEELFRHDQWRVGVVDQPITAFLDPVFIPKVRWLSPARRRGYCADPFGMVGDAGLEVYCEAWTARTGLGHLARLDAGEPQPLLGFPADLHLSYPYMVEEDGEFYCVPESCQAGEVCLYRRVGNEWVYAATLLPDFPGVDATLFPHEGRWWLACTNQATDPNAELWLWHAPTLRGAWTPHRRNPVKRDPASARPAGTPFLHEETLYRPAQDCRAGYGAAVAINKVLRLTPDQFLEQTVLQLRPPRHWKQWRAGWHTLSAVGAITLVDAKRVAFLPGEFRRVFIRKLRRALTRSRRS